MSITAQQIDLWRGAKSETEHLEFKAATTSFSQEELYRYCVAIGNEGGGHLILGVADKPPRPVVGTQAFQNVLQTKHDLLTKLQFRVDIEQVAHPDGRVLVFVIPSRPRGHAYDVDGAYYMRSGSSLVRMSFDQLRKIALENTPLHRVRTFLWVVLALTIGGAFGWSLHPKPVSVANKPQFNSEPTTASLDKTKPEPTNSVSAQDEKGKSQSPKQKSNQIHNLGPEKQQQPVTQTQIPNQVASAPVPQTFREQVLFLNRNAAKADREHLAAAFYEFADSLGQGQTLMYKGFQEAGAISQDGTNITKTISVHIKNLRKFEAEAMAYGKEHMALRNKWNYYPKQTAYIFGDNPDNLGWGKLASTFNKYAVQLEEWSVIQNKDDKPVQNMLFEYKNQFDEGLKQYADFFNGCKSRLDEMKESIQ